MSDLTPVSPAAAPASAVATPAPRVYNKGFSQVKDIFNKIYQSRANLGLPNPGTTENINKEVSRDVLLTPFFFTGLKADVSKSFSLQPVFQVSHALALGSPVLPNYAFGSAYANENTMMQGNIESDLSLTGRAQRVWNSAHTSRAQFQLGDSQPAALVQLEHDYLGPDFSLTLRALNPSITSGTLSGVYTGSLLQSVTKKLALGIETLYSMPASKEVPSDVSTSYFARYTSTNWIASVQARGTGQTVLSFYKKIADKVEAGIETEIGPNPNAMLLGTGNLIDGTTSIGAKYEFRQSIFRGKIDSTGKVSCLVERQVLPILALSFAGEIDHVAKTAKVGLGLQFEAGSEEVFEQQMQLQQQMANAGAGAGTGAPSTPSA